MKKQIWIMYSIVKHGIDKFKCMIELLLKFFCIKIESCVMPYQIIISSIIIIVKLNNLYEYILCRCTSKFLKICSNIHIFSHTEKICKYPAILLFSTPTIPVHFQA